MQSFGQNPVIDIEDQDGTRIDGVYYKDVNHYLDPFVGTWIYSNGNTLLKIVLVKKVMAYNTQYYEDLLIGEYQYIEDGVERINTLPHLATVFPNQRKHNLDGNSILDNIDIPRCPECVPAEKRVRFAFTDPIRNSGGGMVARIITIGGIPAMKIFKREMGMAYDTSEPAPLRSFVPSGEYILLKQ